MARFEDLDVVARGQHGLVHRDQLIGAGLSPSALSRWVAGGRLVRVFPCVYRLAGSRLTWAQRLLAAVLAGGVGTMASHRSAARLWGLLEDDALDVTVPADRRPRLAGVTVHRYLDAGAARPFVRGGIPATDPHRTLADLGAVVDRATLEDVLDRALAQRLVTVVGVERALEEVARSGRRGAGPLRTVLDQRALGADPPDSVLEARMARLLRRHGLPPPSFQHRIVAGGRLVARVDFAYPDVRLAIEVDGFSVHSSPRALQADLRRQNALIGLGWTVLRFTWLDVIRHPDRVAAMIRQTLWTLATA